MNDIFVYSLVSVIIVSLLSFLGLLFFKIKEKNLKRILVYLISIAAGALFGDVFIHLIPEIAQNSGFTIWVSMSFLLGVLIFFVLEKIVHGQQYHTHEGHEHHALGKKEKVKPLAYMSLMASTLHNFLDGVVVAAAYLVSIPAGVGTTFAIILHEIPHEIGSFSILLHGGFKKSRALLVNFISALAAILGALVALFISSGIENIQSILVPLAAGGLLYIAGSDLIPELHKEASGIKCSLIQVLMLLVGMGLMLLLLVVG